jgi:UDP-2,3-diacylglucosamine hydrolase
VNAPAVPRFAQLQAPANWRTADFLSDLHLQPSEPATVEAWRRYLSATPADAVFILGDLFEAWVGDDDAREPGFTADCAQVLREAAGRRPMFFMHGNRDFLLGTAYAAASGMTLLHDPTVLHFLGRPWLLTHGDALCLDDTAYMAFRAQVRTPEWQQQVLARPLAERRALARQLRGQSESRKDSGEPYADVDTAAALQWLHVAQAGVMIHGHTHRPREHELAPGHRRIVLSDWDLAARPPRAEVLRLSAAGEQRIALA